MIGLLLLASILPPPANPQGPNRLSTLELASGWHSNAQGERERDERALPGRDVQLFDGSSLAGWHLIGEANFSANEHSILAQTSIGKSNSFLVTNDTFGDFLLELELKNEQPGNSGIQIRSRVVGTEPKTSYASGYQIEIDPSARAWSGGLYEERGRGWLQNLEHNEAGRKAFRPGEWNRYRIECVGPWIRAWVNGVPTADALDPESLDGILALQVHSGQDTKLRFRNFRLHVYGMHAWTAISAKDFASNGAKLGNDFALRLTRPSAAPSLAGFRLCFRGESPSADSTHRCSFPLDDPRLPNTRDHSDWKQLTLLAYSDRLAIFRDHELILESRDPSAADGPWVWIEKAADAGGPLPFEHVESLEPATR